jgi:IS30 family transposase
MKIKNGRLRHFYKKGTDFAEVTDFELQQATRKINNYPLEVLDWKTPAEALKEELIKAGFL